MKRKFFIAIYLLILASCQNSSSHNKIQKESKLIHIIPLGKVDSSLLAFTQHAIENFYQYECKIQA